MTIQHRFQVAVLLVLWVLVVGLVIREVKVLIGKNKKKLTNIIEREVSSTENISEIQYITEKSVGQ